MIAISYFRLRFGFHRGTTRRIPPEVQIPNDIIYIMIEHASFNFGGELSTIRLNF